jgi:hypothetical protein
MVKGGGAGTGGPFGRRMIVWIASHACATSADAATIDKTIKLESSAARRKYEIAFFVLEQVIVVS